MLTRKQKEVRHAKKVADYKDVRSGDNYWFLEVLITMQSEGKITFGEFGLLAGSVMGRGKS